MRWLALLCAGILAACVQRHDAAALIGGYQLLAMNPNEVYVANSEKELILGPTIESVGIIDSEIVVYCGWQQRSVNGFHNTVGYNVIDTKVGSVVKGLDEKAMMSALRGKNLAVPSLNSPAKYFGGTSN